MGKKGFVCVLRYALLTSGLCILGAPAVMGQILEAQPAGASGLEEIVVTARRSAENLTQLPTSITVFGGEDIERRRIVNIADYALQTPNVSLIDGGSRDRNTLSIRGVSTVGGSLSGNFALYVDQLNVIAFVSNPQLHDVERIEVLRGPQGTFFGRNAAGGAINISTVQPRDVFEGSLAAGIANYGSYEVKGTVNVPVSDRFALRANAYYSSTEGFIRNVNPVGGTDFQHNLNLRLAARLKVTDTLTVDASITHADETSGLETGVPTGVLSINAFGFFGTPRLDGIEAFPANRREVNHNTPRRTGFRYTILNGRITYENDDISVTSVTGYLHGRRSERGDLDNSDLNAFILDSAYTRPIVSQEFRVASVGDGRLRWTIGGLYANEKFDSRFDAYTGDENPFGLPGDALVQGDASFQRQSSYAVFGEADFKVTEQLTLTYGGRFTRDRNAAGTTFTSSFGPPTVNEATPATFENFSSKFAARFDFSDEISAYLLASQGYRAGGVQPSTGGALPAFEDETLWNYEAGIKGFAFDRRLRFGASVYRIDWKDLQVSTFVQVTGPGSSVPVLVTGTQNAASARSTGAELELVARPLEPLELGFTAGYTDAKFRDFQNAAVAGATGPVDLSGKTMFNSPKWTLSGNAQYDVALGDDVDAFIRGEWSYRSSTVTSSLVYVPPSQFPFPVNFDFPYRAPSFSVWNLRVGASKGNYKLTAYVENLFDKNYYTGTFDNIYASGVYVRPHLRRFGAGLSVAF